jgi:hypothetical protein
VTDHETIHRVKRAAQIALLHIPGVRAVSIGHKFVGGQETDELSIIVKVAKKRPASTIPAHELIPARIEGVATDVKQWLPRKPLVALTNDFKKERPLLGGSFIVAAFTDPQDGSVVEKHGTLGFIAKTDGSIPDIPPGGIVGVTNQHCISNTLNQTVKGQPVGNNSTYDCSRCSDCCTDNIGAVLLGVLEKTNADPNHVDAALIALREGMDYYADVKHIGNITGVRPPLTSADVGLAVQKYGASTGYTRGTVTEVEEATLDGSGTHVKDATILIKADSGTPQWDCCLCVQGQPVCGQQDPPMPESFVSFACGGDSGSALCDMQGKVVGLIRAAECGGLTAATGIDVVMQKLGITVLTAAAAVQKQTVPKVAGVNAMVGAAAQPVAVPFRVSPAQLAAFVEARDEIVATPLGRLGADTVRTHQEEVARLVTTHRRMGAVWRRNGGPELVEHGLRMLHLHDHPMPPAIGGRPLSECLSRIQHAFERFGSPALAAAAQYWGPILAPFLGMNYNQVLATLHAGGE